MEVLSGIEPPIKSFAGSRLTTWLQYLINLVPKGGLEPPRSEERRILSPLRLPIPPSGQIKTPDFSSEAASLNSKIWNQIAAPISLNSSE